MRRHNKDVLQAHADAHKHTATKPRNENTIQSSSCHPPARLHKRRGHVERLVGVDRRPRPKLPGLLGAQPAAATVAAVVVAVDGRVTRVGCGVPRARVGFLSVKLGAVHAADFVGVTVVIAGFRGHGAPGGVQARPVQAGVTKANTQQQKSTRTTQQRRANGALEHSRGNKIHRGVAGARHTGQVHRVLQLAAKERHVVKHVRPKLRRAHAAEGHAGRRRPLQRHGAAGRRHAAA